MKKKCSVTFCQKSYKMDLFPLSHPSTSTFVSRNKTMNVCSLPSLCNKIKITKLVQSAMKNLDNYRISGPTTCSKCYTN